MCGARRRPPRGSGWATRARGTACSRWTMTGGGPGGTGRRSPGRPPWARTSWPGGCASAAAAKRDVSAMSAATRAAFRRTRGASTQRRWRSGALPLPGRYPVEPWEPWHSVAAFKVRHVLMGQWQHKLAQRGPARAGRAGGVRAAGDAASRRARHSSVPPDGAAVQARGRSAHGRDRAPGLPRRGGTGLQRVGGQRARGRPTAGRSSATTRTALLDTPNVYWQCRVSCPDWDVDRGDVSRAARVPALRFQWGGGLGDHTRRRGQRRISTWSGSRGPGT